MNSTLDFQFPTRRKGRQTAEAEAEYDTNVIRLYTWMRRYVQRLGFAPSSRGWCYALESEGLITKGEFDKAIRTLAQLRKSGQIDFDLVASDDARAMSGYDFVDEALTPEHHLIERLRHALKQGRDYRPVSYWKHQFYYPIVMVEKIDLVNLFRQALPHAVEIFNARGWADVNSRVKLLERCQWALDNDLEPVILYCGDHDPAGLQISDTLRGQLTEIAETVDFGGVNPNADDDWLDIENLRIIRFGLNQAQIEAGGLSWIDNLETSGGKNLASPRHPDHNKPYVQTYLAGYGARKVEANALVAKPEFGRAIMRAAIGRWLDEDAIWLWEEENKEATQRAGEMADKVTAWLALLEAAGYLFDPVAALPSAEQIRQIMPGYDDDDDEIDS